MIARVTMKKSYTHNTASIWLPSITPPESTDARPPRPKYSNIFESRRPRCTQMILTLEAHRLIERTPGQARSIRLLIPPEKLPDLI
jgi:hypothetical protein